MLKAVHLWDHENRRKTIIAIVKVFDSAIQDVVGLFIGSEIYRIKQKTLLDVIIWARSFFEEFLDSEHFVDSFKSVLNEMSKNPSQYNDIIRYCIAYNLSVKENDAKYLEDFIS
ncbi:hypothetical protein ACJVDH_08150 [Pedobacter sp. AW1-32]|uniref:hypothetical protein n=1 Tax=Pedobacter sp. AW1-32 TaxID=3383026 RepID=UPI003FEE2C96